jgi:DNA-binding HxlR family transcriptional regulator
MKESPLARALDRIGERWTLLIVDALLAGPLRFNELQDAVAGIAPNTLSQRLRRLEGEALLVARPYSERPRRFTYELTAVGHELASALRLLADWGGRGAPDAEPVTHALCGTPLRVRWWCPTCDEAVDGGETIQAVVV